MLMIFLRLIHYLSPPPPFSAAAESIDPVSTDPHSGTSTRSFDPDSVIDPSKSSLASKTSFRPLAHLVITDPDHIEKSNLNRQFLFRPEHIGQSKSQVAADVIRQINPSIRIRPMEQKSKTKCFQGFLTWKVTFFVCSVWF
ncbi:Ubiquitin modifier-activating enzyme 6 [Fasciolopsis buskii]|uniref:Ubiquitin modifier-activating enzyme 6 n=1 Tax=Fasciolopsis buskii TaxID=27845 RepID=A0A8E0RVL8_9TREM|nr:Ubiquitin modifier-activating enzyme 6 [Fasciolopsis buski]